MCKDGTFYSGESHRGACSRHKGVKQWLDTPPAKVAANNATPPASVNPRPQAQSPRPEPQASPPSPTSLDSTKVWVNLASKVYHCANDRWYGKTKKGEYLPEAEAKAHGFRPDHGKGCQA
jgi:hypothetical protein